MPRPEVLALSRACRELVEVLAALGVFLVGIRPENAGQKADKVDT
ncbi:hypothetical protein [Paucidesulfovibrio gracilis]|nr:hypothetical protein [Paucidesulfovibrio gracilis]